MKDERWKMKDDYDDDYGGLRVKDKRWRSQVVGWRMIMMTMMILIMIIMIMMNDVCWKMKEEGC